jgi:prepilin-type N-terminal cleavage/methylation domain-containing protein
MKKRKNRTFQARASQCCHSREGGNPVFNCWIPGQARNDKLGGFTLVELILVVLIISIAAVIAIPMFSSAADIQVRSVANRIAADLDYARGLAITRQKNYAVVFYPAAVSGHTAESYEILDTAAGTVITNPLDGRPFTVELTKDSRVNGVDIYLIEGAPGNAITFNYLGTPSLLTGPGWITLKFKDGTFVVYVKIEMLTGCVTITDTKE